MLLLILGSLIIRGEEEEEGTDADGVRQDRSSGNLSRSGRVKLWDRKDRAGGKKLRSRGRSRDRGGKVAAAPLRNPPPSLE